MRSIHQPLITRDETFLDTETTGLDPVVNEVIEFAGVKRCPAGDVIDAIHLDVRALYVKAPPPWAASMPGFNRAAWYDNILNALAINGQDVEEITSPDRMHPDEAARQIAVFIRNTTIIGQNPSFDLSFLVQMVKRAGLTQSDQEGNLGPLRLPYHKIDTCGLAYEHLRHLGLKNLSLSKPGGICDFLGIPIKNAHTAMGDVNMTMKVYDRLLRAGWLNRLMLRFHNGNN